MSEKTLLCYGDSLTWWRIPFSDKRISFEKRRPNVLGNLLWNEYVVVEEWLRWRSIKQGRKEGRNGLEYFYPCLLSHLPIEILILFLGTNNLFSEYENFGDYMKEAFSEYNTVIQKASKELDMEYPKIILVAPPHIDTSLDPWNPQNQLIESNCSIIAEIYQEVAVKQWWGFLDANKIVWYGRGDGVHIDEEQNFLLWETLYKIII